MPVGRNHGRNNQEGTITPTTSQWGQALNGSLSQLIDQPTPIGTRRHNFGGTIGGLAMVAASIAPVFTHPGYFGDVPESQQGTVDAPEPWDRA